MITRKLSRKRGHRVRMLANLTASMILYEKVKTTVSKAKEAKRIIDKCVSIGKVGDLNSRRRLLAILPDKAAAIKILEVLSPRYKKINGSVVRILNLGPRLGDGAPMALMLLKQEEILPVKEIKKEIGKKEKKNGKKDNNTQN